MLLNEVEELKIHKPSFWGPGDRKIAQPDVVRFEGRTLANQRL